MSKTILDLEDKISELEQINCIIELMRMACLQTHENLPQEDLELALYYINNAQKRGLEEASAIAIELFNSNKRKE